MHIKFKRLGYQRLGIFVTADNLPRKIQLII